MKTEIRERPLGRRILYDVFVDDNIACTTAYKKVAKRYVETVERLHRIFSDPDETDIS